MMQAPPKHWLLGHLPALRSNPLGLLDQCEGNVVPLRLGKTAWLVLHPRDVAHVLEHSESHYSKGRVFRHGRRLYGNSLLVSEGAKHREQVKQIGGLFFRHAAQSFLQPAIEITRQWLTRWQMEEPFDLWSSVVELTLAISSQAIFGKDYLPAWLTGREDQQANNILLSYDIAMGHVARQSFSLLPLPDWIPTPSHRRYWQAIRTLNSALAKSVQDRQAGKSEGGFIDILLAIHRKSPSQLSLQQVRDQSLVLLLGGYESTATALCWTILLLAKHETVRQRLQEEIRRCNSSDSQPENQVGQLKYTAQVFSESLRLYPPPWLIPRTAVRDDTLPSGHRISRHAQLFLSPYRTQRDPAWFDHPLQFNPDRFNTENVATIQAGSYFPFGLGPRRCLGESIARSQVALILATLFRDQGFELKGGAIPRPDPLLTLRPSSPVLVCRTSGTA